MRIFHKFETVVGYLKGIGIARFDVDAANYGADSLKATRSLPDQPSAMKSAHQTAAHSRWLKEQVQKATDDPGPSIEHGQVTKNFDAKLASLRNGGANGKVSA